eukprot:c889_g1_i1.p1 GENE.c889_g1_i1~~c889_g1_i1.p1  ORF type:complete len:305 (+),score=76.68 c889_g1_i1:32-916(+)
MNKLFLFSFLLVLCLEPVFSQGGFIQSIVTQNGKTNRFNDFQATLSSQIKKSPKTVETISETARILLRRVGDIFETESGGKIWKVLLLYSTKTADILNLPEVKEVLSSKPSTFFNGAADLSQNNNSTEEVINEVSFVEIFTLTDHTKAHHKRHSFLYHTLGLFILLFICTYLVITIHVSTGLFSEILVRDKRTMSLTRKCQNIGFGLKVGGYPLSLYICSLSRLFLGIILIALVLMLCYVIFSCLKEIIFSVIFAILDIPLFVLCVGLIGVIALWSMTTYFLTPVRFAGITTYL